MIFLLNIFSICTLAQAGNGSNMDQRIYKFNMTSPETAGMDKYGEIPVSLHTGVPNISVPLYTITLPGFNLPIGLSYHAGGIKVDEVASTTGIGWSLEGVGAIRQQRNGMSDFTPLYGWLFNSEKVTDYPISGEPYWTVIYPPSAYHSYMVRAAVGTTDSQADMFSYTVPGESGKFYFNQSKQVFFAPKRNNKLSFAPLNPLVSSIDSFTLRDEKGNTFIFGEFEFIRTVKHGGATPLHDALKLATGDPNPEDWGYTYHLTKIITRNNDTIRYTYETTAGTTIRNQMSETRYSRYAGITDCILPEPTATLTYTYLTGTRIKEIVSSRGHVVKFNYSSMSRKDLEGSNALTEINIFYQTNLVKKYSLNYDYFYSGWPDTTQDNYRLKLLSVQEQGKPATTFHYNETGGSIPKRLSYSQDHWGYNNGAGNTTLLPANAAKGFPLGANRQVNVFEAKRGILAEIRYPTGGKTVFSYEGNDGTFTGKKQVFTESTRRGLSSPGEVSITNITIPQNAYGIIARWVGPTTTGAEYVRISSVVTGSTINFSGLSPTTGAAQSLMPGEYVIEILEDAASGAGYFLRLNWFSEALVDTTYTHPVGGLRISSIKSYANVSDATPAFSKFYSYKRFDNPSLSSGISAGLPQYEYTARTAYVFGEMIPNRCTEVITQVAGNMAVAGIYQGGPVAYNNVEERTDSLGTIGRTRYFYYNNSFAKIMPLYPFTQVMSADWAVGQLLASATSGNVSGSFVNAQIIRNSLNIEGHDYDTDVLNLSVGIEAIDYVTWTMVHLAYSPYYFFTGQTLLTKEEKVQFPVGSTADSVKTIKHYFYDSPKHVKPTRIVEESSNRSLLTKNKYPLDYDTAAITNNNAKGITLLARKNIYEEPVETFSQIKKDGSSDSLTTAGVLRHYNPLNTVVDSVSVLQVSQPLATFSPSTITSGSLSKNANYKTEVVASLYDDRNNVLEQKHTNKRTVESFIWDYKKFYPVAKASNALYADIAYTSFEADGKGNWAFSGVTAADNTSPTGTRCYAVQNGALTKAVSSGKTYLVSYWTKNGTPFTISGTQAGFPLTLRTFNGWTLYQHKITGVTQVQVSGTGFIDELRLHPIEAQMETSTYDPLVGIISQSDVSGHISYYVYDANKRLYLIKDLDGRILKQFDYQYQAVGF